MAGPVGDGGGKTRPDLEKLYKNAKSEQIPQIDQIIKETCKIDIGDIRRKLISLEHQKKGSQTPLGEESEAVMIVNSEGKATFDTEDLRKSIEKLKKLFDNDDPLGFASKLDFEN